MDTFLCLLAKNVVYHFPCHVLVVGDIEPKEAHVPTEGCLFNMHAIHLHLRDLVSPMMTICILIKIMHF